MKHSKLSQNKSIPQISLCGKNTHLNKCVIDEAILNLYLYGTFQKTTL